MTRTRTVESKREMGRVVDDYAGRGYTVVSNSETLASLRYRDHGGLAAHVLLFVFFGWWTLGATNACYALWRRWRSADHVQVRVEE